MVQELEEAAGMTRLIREPPPLDQIPVWAESETTSHEAFGTEGEAVGVDALLAGLNAEQRRCVTHGEGPLLVVAGAGTGKTQVITRRIAWLIATRRARPSEILALTFTDKAAAEMQVRVDQLVPYGYTDTNVSTFHAFGDRIIREYAFELGLPNDVRVLSRPEVVIFLREHLFDFELDEYRPLGDPTRFLDALATLFSRCKDEDISPEAYIAHADRLRVLAERAAAEIEGATASVGVVDPQAGDGRGGTHAGSEAAGLPDEAPVTDSRRDAADALAEDARRQGELARAYAKYQELLGRAGFIDFGDQVSLALRLLRESPAAREALQGRFRYVLVDEFQDTNRAQSELVAVLAERHRNVTVVGDDDQSIYKFRGAAISNILEFQARYRRAKTVVLRRNYRSLTSILEASYRLIRFNDPDRLEVRAGVSKRLVPARTTDRPTPVRQVAFATGSEEADWVAAEIGRRVAAGGRPRDQAILVRANAHADPFLRSLNLAGIPWRFSGTSGLYTRPEVRLLIAFLRAIADLSSSMDVYALAASDIYGLEGPELTAIVNSARRRNRSLWEVLEELDRQPGIIRLAPNTRTAVTRLVADLRGHSEVARTRPAGEVLYQFLRGSGLLSRLASGESIAAEEALSNIARFFDIIRAQSALLADDRIAFVAPHIQTLIEAGDDPPTADIDPDADAVSVLTVHKAKGLEFPVVFLVGLVAGRFPTISRREPLAVPVELVRETLPTGDFQLQEERRLFYVGMTRARDELVLTHAADYGGVRARRISPFVLEALDLPSTASIPGSGVRDAAPLEKLAAFEAVAAPVDAARPPSDEPLSLSFYQIDDYLTCPLKFKYVHVLRVPIAPHHSIVYGSALHKAVQEFHRRQARGQIMSDDELGGAFEAAWTNEGFLTREHEEARLEAGRAALRRFRAAQLEPGAVIPAYVEREFSFTLDGDRIRGRWDRVDIERIEDGSPEHGSPPAAGSSRETALIGAPVREGVRADVPSEPPGFFDVPGSVHADVVSPTLPGLHRERVTITDYKSSDVHDPARARQRARDSLQLSIYALGYQAQTGRLPDAVQLYFLESGLIGRADVDERRLTKARDQIGRAASGIRARAFDATPDYLACSWCAFREICPMSVAR